MKLLSGKLNIVIDGQFGSTGKGLISCYASTLNHIDLSITNASANAGHTFYHHGKKYIVKHLPVSGIINNKSTIYLCAGAIIHPETLLYEIDKVLDGDDSRICIHPRAAIIRDSDIHLERNRNSSVARIASTQSGVGAALVRKINRSAILAKDTPELSHLIKEVDIQQLLDDGCTALMEVPQGFDLSISSGFSYPYCTSREITISGAMADAQVHPIYLGKVIVSIRTFPIRVGNIYKDGHEIGNSGPFYPDSKEIKWDDIGVVPELTTVTKRPRRVATFSMIQYRRMIHYLKPDYIFLNFANYLSKCELGNMLKELPEVTHLGFGPEFKDIMKL